jgi:catechol 2,3-dioxygenase-like lactoylglutathione lyase family enzyme
MEGEIARLLREFEDGKMTRRQLIQSLAVVAAVAAPGSVVAQTPAKPAPPIPNAFEPTGWKTVWLDHISYQVSDYRRSAAFYRDLMGWTVRNDNGENQATLDINGIGEIIMRQPRAPGANAGAAAAGGRAGAAPITGVINHISWGIQSWDTDKVESELKKRGLAPRPDMVGDTFKSWHVRDPDGWDLQISNQTKS